MADQMRILLLEDDLALGEAIRDHLASLGHGVDWLCSVGVARQAWRSAPYELMLLDQRLPDGSGLDLLREIRSRADTVPIIFVTAQDQIAARIEGLNSGADDYLVKPFDLNELVARVTAVARRKGGQPNPALCIGSLQIDIANRTVLAAGLPVELTAREWALLERLLRNPARVASKSQLEESLYSFDEGVESNTVEVYVSRLRKKLGRDVIVTLRGLGYRMGPL